MKISFKESPLVSVVIPCYNHAQFVQETIQSIIDQDYENIELIIIDDGSSDNSVKVIKEMLPACEGRFTRFEFRHRTNKGLCTTLNESLDWSKGEFFSAIASDDIALSHKISFLVDKIISSDYAAVFGGIKEISKKQNNNIFSSNIEHSFHNLILQKNLPSAPAAMIRTSDLKEVGGYNVNVKIEDWYMWLTLTNCGKRICSFPEVLALYRKHENNTINNIELMHDNRVKIIDLFSSSPVYEKAKRRNFYIKSRVVSGEKFLEPLFLLCKSRHFNYEGLIVIVKIFSPKMLLRHMRDLLN